MIIKDDIQENQPCNESSISVGSNASVNWMEKLKPSSKNKLIARRYKQLSNMEQIPDFNEDLTKCDQTAHIVSKIQNEDSILNQSTTGKSSSRGYLDKWNKCVVQSKFNNLHINISETNGSVLHIGELDLTQENEVDNSIQYFEALGDMIEENFKNAYNENMFLKNQEGHSIIPFLLITSKEVHRMCLSDYEIKHIYKSYKSKSKSFRAEAFDFYRIGLINFYKGKYHLAYSNFRSAVKLKADPNFVKWLCFAGIILLFCDTGKIDFSSIYKFQEEKQNVSKVDESESFSVFSCCASRKANATPESKIKSVQMMTAAENKQSNSNQENAYLNFSYNAYREKVNNSVDRDQLANEVMEYIDLVIEKNNSKNLLIEGWWILLLISSYAILHQDQKLFDKKKLFDPKFCIKKIKEQDDYLSYIAYAEYSYIVDNNFQIDKLLKQLILKFPNKVEAYLRYWQLLTKGKLKNFELANAISEVYWKNSSTIQFDDGIYGLYILITHAKSSYLIGNHFYAITYFQKEYPSNFLFPSIFYLFGKYSSKSNSKSLKNISISSLKEVFRLLYEDLQYSALYWLGNIYYNTGSYDHCFKVWKLYLENADKSFDISFKKTERIKSFLKKYEVLWNSLNEFKKNLNFIKKIKNNNSGSKGGNHGSTIPKDKLDKIENFEKSKKFENFDNLEKTNKTNNLTSNMTTSVGITTTMHSSKINNYLKILQSIKEIEVNLKLNKSIVYEYYKAMCYFYIDRNIPDAIKILMNIINTKKHYMRGLFALWKILEYLKEYKLLLNFSFFIVKISHMNEVSFSDWIKSYIFYSKALMLNKKYDEAIMLLINTLDVFAHVPLEEAKYLNVIYKQNKISTTNFFVNFDKAKQFYSKYHVYKKSQGIFQINYTLKKSKKNMKNEKFILNVNDINEDGVIGSSNMTSNASKNLQSDCTVTDESAVLFKDILIDSVNKLESYIEANIDAIEVPTESPFLTIISSPEILLQIGKLCAKSKTKRELGLMCLDDYILLLKFGNNYKLSEENETKKQKALFWMSVLHIQLKQYNQAKQCIDKIDKLYEFDFLKKKSKIVKMFLDYYKQIVNHNESVSFDFDISMEDLRDI